MENIASEVTIYKTRDYGRFRNIQGNRMVNQKRVQRIAGVVKTGLDMLPFVPVVVDQNFGIIDGQHRYLVAKELKREVYYVIRTSVKIRDIARINSHVEKWGYKDYMNCYINLGIRDYKILDQFIDKYKHISLSLAVQLLQKGKVQTAGFARDGFKNGEFKADNEEDAQKTAELIKSLLPYTDKINRALVVALVKMRLAGLYSHKTLLDKLRLSGTRLRAFDNPKDCLLELEAVYNWNNSKRQVIY